MDNSRKVVYWDCEGSELLTYTSIDEAVEAYLDSFFSFADCPETVEVCGYARRVITTELYYVWAIEALIENLDEDYGGEECFEITEGMRQASKRFVDSVLSEYTVFQCEVIETKTIEVRPWVEKNRSTLD